jgi:hypothetical protein
MTNNIIRYDDRKWTLPLKGYRVIDIRRDRSSVHLLFDHDLTLTIGYTSTLSPIFRGSGDADRHPLAEWDMSVVKRSLLAAVVNSSVACIDGQLRLVFRNGFTLRARADDPEFPAEMRIGAAVFWDHAGVHETAGYEIYRLVIPSPPYWPESDDINDIPPLSPDVMEDLRKRFPPPSAK